MAADPNSQNPTEPRFQPFPQGRAQPPRTWDQWPESWRRFGESRADQFLKVAGEFRLGALPTEMPHPWTKDLSDLCHQRLDDAARIFTQIEIEVFSQLLEQERPLRALMQSCERALQSGRRIFIVGCGATGRLALALERAWRSQASDAWKERIVAFTAGGDSALVRSQGVFEDHPQLGELHLRQLGFQNDDLLIGVTEGGETPFVLGAVEAAAQSAHEVPWLLFCNPPKTLRKVAARSARAMDHSRIRWHALDFGPMVIAGSTRLQASSALMAFVGAALFEAGGHGRARWFISDVRDRLTRTDPTLFLPMIELESETYRQNHYALHRGIGGEAGLAVLTDTTERAPTFGLAPFENELDFNTPQAPVAVSKTYLELRRPDGSLIGDSREAWIELLGRVPRGLDWQTENLPGAARGLKFLPLNEKRLLGFNFSSTVEDARRSRGAGTRLVMEVQSRADVIEFSARARRDQSEVMHQVQAEGSASSLVRSLLLKSYLNMQSTLAMGRLDRFAGNWMTYVRPANNKLIDRSLRILRHLAERLATSSPSATQDLDSVAQGPHASSHTPLRPLHPFAWQIDPRRARYVAREMPERELLAMLFAMAEVADAEDSVVWNTLALALCTKP
ncbi:MAG TPA: SIS domain-containing protein [Pseudobdellovibrionaceae bacterium]|nr:SIS domain-containing protein [Pseudobdellovibrionaceae bacterium]